MTQYEKRCDVGGERTGMGGEGNEQGKGDWRWERLTRKGGDEDCGRGV